METLCSGCAAAAAPCDVTADIGRAAELGLPAEGEKEDDKWRANVKLELPEVIAAESLKDDCAEAMVEEKATEFGADTGRGLRMGATGERWLCCCCRGTGLSII
jgi:hypothetical protein